ncbi:hypothetical protein EW146_g6769 [Bondarzewia mesenterica]|uniref:Protein kinase regulator n=1 Tax=Bondarzewia mesenterica TaxID=1095465 RepID=A0A4S4LML6_9AGAM|nr:hypothetical protein EW146_g6769 [Bondarzewia mesenterica]
MDVANPEPRGRIVDWGEDDVQLFLSNLGYPQYENQIREHNISGDVLCIIDAESLKEIGIATVGQRLAILKAIYLAKLAHNVPIKPGQYIPPSEAEERAEFLSVDRLYELIRDQDDRLRTLEMENQRLSQTVYTTLDDLNSMRSSHSSSRPEDSPIARQPSFKWAQYVKSTGSPTKPEITESPHASPHRLEHDLSYNRSMTLPTQSTSQLKPTSAHPSSSPNPNGTLAAPSKPVRQESSDNLKSFKVSLEDPAWKVLPAALRKYKINNDDWQNYAMFICYGPPSNRIERCLSYDEKPLLLFQKLKDAQKNPVFMLKHIKDIRSPIAVAQQKQAARKASSNDPAAAAKKAGSGHGRSLSRPPRLQVQSENTLGTPPPMTGVSVQQPGSPEVTSPAVDNKERGEDTSTDKAGLSPDKKSGSGDRVGEPKSAVPLTAVTAASTPDESGASGTPAREVPVTSDISYAVAIYPYMAEQEDEFDVVVGDTFVIISRARGWWVVQRDPTGSGVVDSDTSKQGWVPAGCLLETKVPVATAIAEASAVSGTGSQPPSPVPSNKTPILPLNIVSTSFPGYALMDYKKKGDEELDLMKDDSLRVFKRYNHWSYAVKEDGGDRGWVPSWYIGKVSSSAVAPATPSVTVAPGLNSNSTSVSLDTPDSRLYSNDPSTSGQQLQVSPMSSAFPLQAKATTVI